MPYFAFNNMAYFTSDRDEVEKIYENNKKNFGSLLKKIFSLKRISLESTKKVINNRMHIKNNITNLCDKLNNIMKVIDAATNNQMRLIELQKQLEKNAECEVGQVPYTVTVPYDEVLDKEVRCESGWYVLYCNTCNKVCHKNCKGPNEGWHSSEYGCNMITTFGSKCTECECLDVKHRFKDSYITKETVTKTKQIIKYKIDENAKQTEEEKKRIREQINEQIKTGNKELLERNKVIHYSLREGIDCLFQLALKNNELNLLALKKDNEKYGFTKEILKEKLKNKKNNQLFDIFNNKLDNIEKLCESNVTKEETVTSIENMLLPKQ